MKVFSLLLLYSLMEVAMLGQQSLSRDEALAQLYHEYDATEHTAQWVCTTGQNDSPKRDGWPCTKEYETVNISQLLISEVEEGDGMKTYLVASATPTGGPLEYE